jgi:hypothetical protein
MTAQEELYNTLLEAKKIIRIFHGADIDGRAEEYIWNLYENNAPEMKRINEVLAKYEFLKPTTGESGK